MNDQTEVVVLKRVRERMDADLQRLEKIGKSVERRGDVLTTNLLQHSYDQLKDARRLLHLAIEAHS
jgi:hypothetical protein